LWGRWAAEAEVGRTRAGATPVAAVLARHLDIDVGQSTPTIRQLILPPAPAPKTTIGAVSVNLGREAYHAIGLWRVY